MGSRKRIKDEFLDNLLTREKDLTSSWYGKISAGNWKDKNERNQYNILADNLADEIDRYLAQKDIKESELIREGKNQQEELWTIR